MRQHQVQRAYLDNFASNRKVWVYNKSNDVSRERNTEKLTTLKDFQPLELENFQASQIESPGIVAIRSLIENSNLNDNEYNLIVNWASLHCIRVERFREQPEVDYDSTFHELMEIEKQFSYYFKHAFTYTCSANEYFITSDSPIIEFTLGQDILRIMSLSPDKAILFSPINEPIVHDELSIPQMVNSMYWANAKHYLCSNQSELPIQFFKETSEKWNLKPKFEKNYFSVKQQNS